MLLGAVEVVDLYLKDGNIGIDMLMEEMVEMDWLLYIVDVD